MPVLLLECPDCGHRFRSLVAPGAKTPEVWVCSRCKSRRAAAVEEVANTNHPWAGEEITPCCG